METTNVKSELAQINLSDIKLSTTNAEFFRTDAELSDRSLKEITESVRQNGVITPILLRKSTNGHYILIAGERRYRASLAAGATTIPAYIRSMTDQQAFDLQMIENLERKDVHPMKESLGYHHILNSDPKQTAKDIALRFGKSESYVVQRLKLVDLVASARKAFEKDQLTLSQALLLARLTTDIQKEYINAHRWNDNKFGNLSDLKEFINQHVIHNLTEASFDPEDETLLPKAGPCSLCPKRSGCSPALFADIKGKDRCMDHQCFDAKTEAHQVRHLTETIDSKKDIVFIQSYDQPLEIINQILEERGIKTLKLYHDFNDNDKKGTKVKGYWVSGNKIGTLSTIYLNNKAKALNGNEPTTAKVEISKIQKRVNRSAELDGEKVYAKILDAMHKHPNLKATKKMISEEEAFAWFVIYDKAGYNTKRKLDRILRVPTKLDKVFKFFSTLTTEQKGTLVRQVMMDQYAGNYPTHTHAILLRKVAEAYKDIPISEFEKEQQEIRTKREDRAKQRIKSIKLQGA